MAETMADYLANVLEIHEDRICAFGLPFVKDQEAGAFKVLQVFEAFEWGGIQNPANLKVQIRLRRTVQRFNVEPRVLQTATINRIA